MSKENKGFYLENTVEVVIRGQKVRVNKYEADALKKKLSDSKNKK